MVRQLVGDSPAAALAEGPVSSSVSGSARDVVQARDISGGVHFHTGEPVPQRPVPRQLPAEPLGFVGRARELDALRDAADGGGRGARLIVLEGTAGAGKSALALRFAHRARERFPDGQLFVNLRGHDPGAPLAPGAVLERFLRASGVPPAAVPMELEERAEMYRTLLADHRVLVVLDNAATAGQVRPLLPGGAGCLVLVTSRSRLSALAAREGARRITVGLLEPSEAVALVQEVTRDYRQGDDPDEVAQLAALCARLPLALRIAAERAASRPFLPLAELMVQLREHSTLWDALAIDEGTEADAVRTVFAWSYRTLPPTAAQAFRLLGLHPGPDLNAGAAAALLACPQHSAREMLDALSGAYLLEQTGPARYRFHDLLRAYAADQAEAEEDPEARRAALERVAHWYLGAAHAADQVVRSAPRGELDALAAPIRPTELQFESGRAVADWYLAERENLLALARAADRDQLDKLLWRLVLALEDVLDTAGALDERREFGEIGLAAARRCGEPLAEAAMLENLAFAHKAIGDLDAAARQHRAALDACTRLDYGEGVASSANGLGLIHLHRRELPAAIDRFEQVAAHAHTHDLSTWHAFALDNLALARLRQGHLDQATNLAKQAQDAYQRAAAVSPARLMPYLTAAAAYREAGRLEQAAGQLALARAIVTAGERHLRLEVLLILQEAALALAGGHADTALETYWQLKQLQRPLADPALEAETLTGTAHALTALGRATEALHFRRRALALLRTHLRDTYLLAEGETGLADALDDDVLPQAGYGEARALRQAAHARLRLFDDPRATALRHHIGKALNERGA